MVDVSESAANAVRAHDPANPDAASHRDILYQARLGWALLSRLARASVRAFLVGLLIVLPSLFVPGLPSDANVVVALVALGAALLVFFDYASTSPGLIEFSGAPPFNRIRFLAAFATVALLTGLAWLDAVAPGGGHPLTALATALADAQDFPASPVWVMVESLPADTDPEAAESLRRALALAYPVSLAAIAAFFWAVYIRRWPARNGAFNVWVNLPNFTPRPGDDAGARLAREARSQILLGLLLPFAAAVLLRAAPILSVSVEIGQPLTLIWLATAWAVLPACIVMRGLAMARLAEMIEARQRADAEHGNAPA